MPAAIPLTLVAMIAFAANSLLARQALAGGVMDASSFTVLRILSGALALWLILQFSPSREEKPNQAAISRAGTWGSAAALFAYAILFSFAYLKLGAAMGALILFACVQATMIAVGVFRGDRPSVLEWLGLAVAFSAFVYLVLPGVGRPDPLGSLLMAGAGAAWGIYSLRGRGSATPLADTAGNFMRAGLFCVPFALWSLWEGSITLPGVLLALASGMIASGMGYAIWYRALGALTTFQAALVQLSVPVIAAAGAIAFLGEPMTTRFTIACLFVLGGIATAILAKRRR